MTNFDYLRYEEKFSSFADVAISAEKALKIDMETSVINCRRAMEFAIKWMYSVDKSLEMPYQNNLISLMSTEDFHDLVDDDLWKRLDLIRKVGNRAAHNGKKIKEDEAILCLQNLFIFMDYISYCYGDNYEERTYDVNLLSKSDDVIKIPHYDIDFEALIKENKALKEALTLKRIEQEKTYIPKPLDLSEYETRKIYIDSMLIDSGWVEGKNWINEVELDGMPSDSGKGFADYVLYDDSHRPLAIIEAKKTCVDVSKGRQQAILYADILEKKYNRRPIIFITNGFDVRIIDNQYPERSVSTIYSKRDLEKLFNLRTMKTSLSNVLVDKKIAGRYYQEGAIKSVFDCFDNRNRRKALLVMATGSGKTRTVIALCKALLDAGWIKNILFLADRNSLVTQAKRNFVNLLPNLSCSNIVEDKKNYNANCIFSTYQTMMNVIDSAEDEDGKIFTNGHFDLVICDEAHRSIYNKYKDIFNYFDSLLVGLTATPKDDVDKNTYEIFDLENGVPTYGYELAQAVKDGYLVDYVTIETKMKFLEEGISYDDLSEEEKEQYEETFKNENGNIPDKIDSSALNNWIFNEDTIKQVLHLLMKNGLRIDYGDKIGKTIIFAKNHEHAEKILSVFYKEYPELCKDGRGFAKVIDNYMTYAQSAIDDFSDTKKMPQIAISVDMLDTGIDVPEVLNLVFFKKVMSKSKFWQMIGRGTRLCPLLMSGEDKKEFYIFDFCSNFDFFRMNKLKEAKSSLSIQGAIFVLRFEIAYKLQDLKYQTDNLMEYRSDIVDYMVNKVKQLNRNNFAVKQHLKYVDMYSNKSCYNSITFEDTLIVKEEIAHLIQSDGDEINAVRFDALMFGMKLAYLEGRGYARYKSDLLNKVRSISTVSSIPEIQVKSDIINKILNTDYLDKVDISDLENIRINLRELMKYIPKDVIKYNTNFSDEILSIDWKESELENDDLKNYKAKAEHYIREHQNNIVIAKLKTNRPLTDVDLKNLEQILWSEVGSKDDYERECGDKPLGEFVREITGLDMNVAKEAFAEFLNDTNLDSRQIYFVNQIIEYIVQNGIMKDMSVLQESPFTDRGSVVELFTDLNVWVGIKKVIDEINANAIA